MSISVPCKSEASFRRKPDDLPTLRDTCELLHATATFMLSSRRLAATRWKGDLRLATCSGQGRRPCMAVTCTARTQ